MDRSTDLAISFLTILTVLANLAVVLVIALAAAARAARGPATGEASGTGETGGTGNVVVRLWSRVRGELTAATCVTVAWLVAAVATAGSLYLSEGAGFTPCRLCWVQRGFMYPLVLILPVAGWAAGRADARRAAPDPGVAGRGGADGRTDPGAAYRWVRRLVLAMGASGGAVAVYHLLIQRYPSLESSASCSVSNPCALTWFERLGFVTIPYMSLSAFVLVLTLLVLAGRTETAPSDPVAPGPGRPTPRPPDPGPDATPGEHPRRATGTPTAEHPPTTRQEQTA